MVTCVSKNWVAGNQVEGGLFHRSFFFFKILFIYLQREGKGGRKRNINVQCQLLLTPPPGDLAINPHMCPDWELNQRHFGSPAGAQCTEPHQSGPVYLESGLSIRLPYSKFKLNKNLVLEHSSDLGSPRLSLQGWYDSCRVGHPKDPNSSQNPSLQPTAV